MSSFSVYTGRWTDYSRGSTLGDQITLTTATGNILIAVVAIWITYVGAIAWNLVAYILHQSMISRGERDAFHFQLQAMLRNRYSPDTFIWRTLKVGFAWLRQRKTARGIIFRVLSFTGIAALVYGGFLVAGVLSSLIARSGDVLIVSSQYCGSINGTAIMDLGYDYEMAQYYAVSTAAQMADNQNVAQALTYSQTCYPGSTFHATSADIQAVPATNCNFFSKSNLTYTMTNPGLCPFADETVCSVPQKDVIKFDSGYIDTLHDLGINTKPDERLLFRRAVTCSPMITEGFYEGWQNITANNVTAAVWNYGLNNVQGGVGSGPFLSNATFYYAQSSYKGHEIPYKMMFASTDIQGDAIAYMPDPRVAPNGTSTSLFFLANRAYYADVVTDPWFGGSVPYVVEDGGYSSTYYYNSAPGSVLGCIGEVELCNPNMPGNESCIDWNAVYAWKGGNGNMSADALNLNEHQTWLASLVGSLLTKSNMWEIVNTLDQAGQGLIANDYMYGFGSDISMPLPDYQWQLELQQMFSTGLAFMQRYSVERAAGYNDPILRPYLYHTEQLDWECAIQKFHNNDYLSFSLVGLCLIFGIGGVVMIVSILATIVVPAYQKRTGKGKFRREQWYSSEVLHLQRMVMEDRGLGQTWVGAMDDVPTTSERELFRPFLYTRVEGISPRNSTATPMTDKKRREDPKISVVEKASVSSFNHSASGGNSILEEDAVDEPQVRSEPSRGVPVESRPLMTPVSPITAPNFERAALAEWDRRISDPERQ